MKIGFTTKVLLTAFLPVVLVLTGTFIAMRVAVDTSVQEGAGQAGRELRGTIERVFTGASLAAFLTIFLVSIWSARSIGRPLKTLIAGLRESEARGRLLPVEISSGVEEVEQLVEAFNRASRAILENEDKLSRANLHFIEAMASALDARDVYTAGHSRRVADYACATAREMGLAEDRIDTIRVGALLHDVGKIGVPDAILLKPAELTPEEVLAVQRHPAIGRQIVERIDGFEAYLPIIELHHENHDGSGYPHGLKGDAVPLETRIVHVVDAYDAMTSDRPYRRGMQRAEALVRMVAASGTQFDPVVVAAFQQLQTEQPWDSSEPALRDYVQLARGLAQEHEPALEPRD